MIAIMAIAIAISAIFIGSITSTNTGMYNVQYSWNKLPIKISIYYSIYVLVPKLETIVSK